ncbi:MAG: TIGR01458 family HAD-type hydrolase [Acidimicrobiia bacterium]|nr:TIGR01458 family HAD-type hydrolase [Acidimicrobiia bacterium]
MAGTSTTSPTDRGTVEGVLLDIDGVLAVSWDPIPGAAAAMADLRARELPIRLLTNTTTRSRGGIVAALAAAGIEVDPEDVLTAPVATATWLRHHHPDARVFLLNSGDVGDDFAEVDLVDDNADVVVVGGAGESFTYERLNAAFSQVLDGAGLVGMHRNLFWRTSAGFELDTGAFLAGIEAAACVEATVLGKPSPDLFATAIEALGSTPATTVMVGDDIDNDVLAAQTLGLRGVLVRTGKFRPEVFDARIDAGPESVPDHVIDSVAALPGLMDTLGAPMTRE